jgi:hypothetical protein
MSNDTTKLPTRAKQRMGYFPSHMWRKHSKKVGFPAIGFLSYIWTRPGERNEMGYYPFDIYDAKKELGISPEETERHIKTLQENSLISYDSEEGVVFLRDYMVGQNRIVFTGSIPSNNLKGCIKTLWQMPESPLFLEFIEEAKQLAPDLVRAIIAPNILKDVDYIRFAKELRDLHERLTPVPTPVGTPVPTGVPLSSEVMSNERTKFSIGDGAPIKLSTDLSTFGITLPTLQEEEDPHFNEIFSLFQEKYRTYLLTPHPELYGKGWVSAHQRFTAIEEETGQLETTEWAGAMESYFNERFSGKCDKRIWHFLSEGVALRFLAREGYGGVALLRQMEAMM